MGAGSARMQSTSDSLKLFILQFLKTIDWLLSLHPPGSLLLPLEKDVPHMPFACGWINLTYQRQRYEDHCKIDIREG